MDFITQNQELVITMLSILIVWIIGLIWKKSADKVQIAAALTMILDIVMDIKNDPATSALDDARKKELAVARTDSKLPEKKKNLVLKVFGSIGGAVEFVYKNRKWLFSAAGKLAKAVF